MSRAKTQRAQRKSAIQTKKAHYLLGVLSVLCANSFVGDAQAAAPDALQQFVDHVNALSAKFEQVQKDERGEVLQVSSGRLWLARPDAAAKTGTGKFRWNYEKPYPQSVVCDGVTLWLYDPDLAQVTVRPAGVSLQGTPAQLLSDRAALDRHFTIEAAATGPERGLRLVPKSQDSDFRLIELWFKGGLPRRLRFHDQLGGTSEVSFSEILTPAKLDATVFEFKIPEGVEVISAQ
ncbi:MAG: outer membrane lipoprotein chaperone LolA [Nevskiales bacterium]|nr:outer membrane lipoprotein chaperone LolA [Nevskiales bacterium]